MQISNSLSLFVHTQKEYEMSNVISSIQQNIHSHMLKHVCAIKKEEKQ